ncbi:MAG: TonB-dependent receptor [Bacteroidetes bacterium]|nr:TonB-dependent receptor [Bacteroidota bacterium]
MKKVTFLLFIFLVFTAAMKSQNIADTTVGLKEVTIAIYPGKPLLLHSAVSVSSLSEQELKDHPSSSFLPALNTLPGVRMEERSPGSYRLSVRGSLLRSPFGIRNIKVYMDEFLLTDGGGNTYLNLIDAKAIKTVQVLKGPEGSMFGANTGGVVVLGTESKDSSTASLALSSGSYGLLNGHVALQKQWKKYSIQLDQSYMHSDGYRRNSALERNYTRLLQQFRYAKGTLKLLFLGSQLHYETPGGLTLSQYQEDPRQARPATSKTPGAEEQKAGIYNTTAYGGISNEVQLLPQLKHVITLFGSYTDFKNPFITNYEMRFENTAGLRTYFSLSENFGIMKINWNAGFECEQTRSLISNFKNNKGTKDQLMAKDDLTAGNYFYFSQLSMLISTRLQLEIAASLNNYYYRYKNIFPSDETGVSTKRLNTQLLPRAGISYRIVNNLVWRASASKGYSPPTIAEIRPSDNTIYENLQSEYGWNYETGFRYQALNHRWEADLAFFRFDLRDAIVRRTNTDGAEYFVNAGGTKQQGIEFQSALQLIKKRPSGFLRASKFYNGFTWYDFHFSHYQLNAADYSGNELTGVPMYTANAGIKAEFPFDLSLFLNYNYVERIPLSDDNLFYSEPYHLLALKAGWSYRFRNKTSLEVFAGADNLTDITYSAGNDLNAAGGRFYNAAPRRSFYGGISINL